MQPQRRGLEAAVPPAGRQVFGGRATGAISASDRPSGLNRTDCNCGEQANRASSLPLATSHTRTASPAPEASFVPSGEKERD